MSIFPRPGTSSSVGRAPRCQRGCRRFESGLVLQVSGRPGADWRRGVLVSTAHRGGSRNALRRSSLRVLLGALLILGRILHGAPARAEADGPLLVAAAASLREPLTLVAERFTRGGGAEVTLAFGASSALAAQVRAGAPVDVLAAADERTVEGLERDGLAAPGDRTRFAGNALVAVAAPELRDVVRAPADLALPAVRRFAIPPDAVPAGHYARAWLSRAGLLAALEPRFVSTEDVRATLAAVKGGHADAALVYATDASLAGDGALAFVVPEHEQPDIVYVATRILDCRRPEAASRFLAFLGGPVAAGILRAAGFRAPPPAPPR